MADAVCVDWDDTLVDVETQEWLPGAVDAFRQLLTMYRTVIVHTCRANWAEGRAAIERKLEEIAAKPWTSTVAAERIQIVGKPVASAYIDNRGVHFGGDWRRTVELLNRPGDLQQPIPARATRTRAPQPKLAASVRLGVSTKPAAPRPTFEIRRA